MPSWHRVFAGNDVHPEPEALLGHLHGLGLEVTSRFLYDEAGWFHADLTLPDDEGAVEVECYLATEEGIRAELSTWAAWLETTPEGPAQDRLMLHVIGTRRAYTLHGDSDEAAVVCLALSRLLARATAGVYQVDGQGFFEADGAPLVAE